MAGCKACFLDKAYEQELYARDWDLNTFIFAFSDWSVYCTATFVWLIKLMS